MKKVYRSLLTLTVLAGGLSLYIYKVALPHDVVKKTMEQPYKEVATDKLSSLTINNQYGTIEISRRDGDKKELQLNAYPGALVSRQLLDEIISVLASVSTAEQVEDPESDRASYGLSPALLKITVTQQEAKLPSTLLVGKMNQFAGKRYAQFEGQAEVFFVPDEVFTSSDIKLEALRERRTIRFESYNSARIDIADEGTLEQSEDGVWRVTSPFTMKTDEAAVATFLKSLKDAEVDTYLSTKEMPSSFQKKIVITSKSGQVTELKFSLQKDGVVGAFSYDPYPYKFKSDLAQSLTNIMSSVRVKKPLASITEQSSTHVSVVQKNKDTYSIVASATPEQDKRSWTLEGKEGVLDEKFVSQWFADIKAAKVIGYLQSSKDVGLDKPVRKLELTTSDGSVVVVSVGNPTTVPDPTGNYVSISGYDGEVFIFDKDTINKLFPSLEVLTKGA